MRKTMEVEIIQNNEDDVKEASMKKRHRDDIAYIVFMLLALALIIVIGFGVFRQSCPDPLIPYGALDE